MNKYLQFGCGPGNQLDNWINFDASPTLRIQKIPFVGYLMTKNWPVFDSKTRYGDIVKGLSVPNNSIDIVFSSHTLEHLSLNDFRIALSNTYKIMKSNGSFGLIVPDLNKLVKQYISDVRFKKSRKTASINFMENSYLGYCEHRSSSLSKRLFYTFSNSRHLWMWDEYSLRNELINAGFKNILKGKRHDKYPHFKEVIIPQRLKNSIFFICDK